MLPGIGKPQASLRLLNASGLVVCGLTPLQGWGWLVHVPKATLAASCVWAWAGDTPVGSGARPKAGGGLARDSEGGSRAHSPHPPQAAPRSPHSPLPRGYRGQLPAAPPPGGAGRPGRAPRPPAARAFASPAVSSGTSARVLTRSAPLGLPRPAGLQDLSRGLARRLRPGSEPAAGPGVLHRPC